MHSASFRQLFFYLSLLTGFFLLIEISFYLILYRDYLAQYEFLDTYISNHLTLPINALPGIFYFIFAQLAVHALFCLFITVMTLLLSHLFYLSQHKVVYAGIILWMCGIMTILVINQYAYPNAKFNIITSSVIPSISLPYVIAALTFGWIMCFICVLFGFTKWLFAQRATLKMAAIMLLAVGLAVYAASYFLKPVSYSAATDDQPNIIIVGIDSLRPDFTGLFGKTIPTPFIDSFLKEAVVFSHATTPLARTFPSWVSILTGEYPLHTHIRSVLSPQPQAKNLDTLARVLQHHGYETWFATDETRFSNIDNNMGFDHRLTPPIGLNDFLLGSFNDFPLSNVIVNTAVGQFLFPFSFANRPVYFTYDPDSFIHLLKPALTSHHSKPLFLAIHFCLPHTPYVWSTVPQGKLSVVERYAASVVRVDRQVKDFFTLLEKGHLLDHAVVILLSDHGEALELPGDRVTQPALFVPKRSIPAFYTMGVTREPVDQSVGHGTDVLSMTQYRTLFAWKRYGVKMKARLVTESVSLLDIKPTVLALLHLPLKVADGASLLGLLNGQRNVLPPRHLLLETDFSPPAIHAVQPDIRQVLLEGVALFEIDPLTTRLRVKESAVPIINASKQYADLYANWILALYPKQEKHIPILVNLKTGQWTDDLQTAFARQSPAHVMMQKLKAFYGNEIS
ncbi:MAG TPA: sulfatase-like hydrolase/transferase [Gammaproteobacteria bacterium]|jgi:hypothetical protein|nr:sulfatase-like hydrolase/transferase [Gammaproteobacteria bacterium]